MELIEYLEKNLESTGLEIKEIVRRDYRDRERLSFRLFRNGEKGTVHIKIQKHLHDVNIKIVNISGNLEDLESVELTKNIAESVHHYYENISKERLSFITGMGKIDFTVYEDPAYGIPIERLNLSVRAYNCLTRDGLDTLGKISELTLLELGSLHQMGAKSVEEVAEKLKEYGLSLRHE